MKNVYMEILLLSTMSVLLRTLEATTVYNNFRPTPDTVNHDPLDNNFDEILETTRNEIFPSQYGSYFQPALSTKLQGPAEIRMYCLHDDQFRLTLGTLNSYAHVYCAKNQNSLKTILYYTLPREGLKGDPTNAWYAGIMILRIARNVPICAVHCSAGTRPTVSMGSYYSPTPESYFSVGCSSIYDAPCTAICPEDVYEVESGEVLCSIGTQVGSACTVKCDAGYVSVGANFKTCETTQQWNDEPFRCLVEDVGYAVKYFKKQENLSVNVALTRLRDMLESHLSDVKRTSPTTRRESINSEEMSADLELNKIFENLLVKLSASVPITLKHYKPSCSVNPKERIDCGFEGITPEQCSQRRCCWDSSRINTKWCFQRANGIRPTNSFSKTTRLPEPATSFQQLLQAKLFPPIRHDINPEIPIKSQAFSLSKYSECGCVSSQVSARCLDTPTKRVFCGKMSQAETWPWHAIVHHGGGICGGTLISKNFVLTAAHCLTLYDGQHDTDPSNEIYLGVSTRNNNLDPNTQKRSIKRVIRHPFYHSRGDNFIQNDIAIIQLSSPVEYTKAVRKLCLPGENMLTFPKNCYITGFGITDVKSEASITLQSAEIPLVTTSQCKTYYGDGVNTIENICAGDTRPLSSDACKGDSGGPLACQARDADGCSWYLAGVTSFGKEPCGGGWPGVYVNVSHYESWILSHISPYRD